VTVTVTYKQSLLFSNSCTEFLRFFFVLEEELKSLYRPVVNLHVKKKSYGLYCRKYCFLAQRYCRGISANNTLAFDTSPVHLFSLYLYVINLKILLLWYHVSWAVLRCHVLTLINVIVSQYKHTTLTFSAYCFNGKHNGVYETRTW